MAKGVILTPKRKIDAPIAERMMAQALEYVNRIIEDKLSRVVHYSDTDLSSHATGTAVHGATGAVVGTTNTQTLTNKTLTSPSVNSPTLVLKVTDTDGTTEGEVWYDVSEDKIKFKTAAGVETITSA